MGDREKIVIKENKDFERIWRKTECHKEEQMKGTFI